MERRRHRPDDVIADEDRQHEDRQPEDEGVDGAAGRRMDRAADRIGGLVGEALRRDRRVDGGIRRGLRRVGGRLRRRGGLLGGHRLHHSPPFSAKAGWTTAPSRVRFVALISSSSQSIASAFFSLSIIVSTKV